MKASETTNVLIGLMNKRTFDLLNEKDPEYCTELVKMFGGCVRENGMPVLLVARFGKDQKIDKVTFVNKPEHIEERVGPEVPQDMKNIMHRFWNRLE